MPLDYASVRATRADTFGNLQFHRGVTLDEVHATVGCKLTVPEILPEILPAMRLVG